jgi:hypothetical protein
MPFVARPGWPARNLGLPTLDFPEWGLGGRGRVGLAGCNFWTALLPHSCSLVQNWRCKIELGFFLLSSPLSLSSYVLNSSERLSAYWRSLFHF